MYAVVEIGGHQYKVSEGDLLYVDRQSSDKDQKLTFDRVLMLKDDDGKVTVGKPVIEGATVEAVLVDNVKSDKVIVFKKKRRKGYRVKRGHRQQMSQIEIESISASGAKKAKASKKAEKKAAPKKEQKKETKEAKQPSTVSTDMTAKEAIDHINNTPLDRLKGFVPDSEDRVTVQRAWESKQEE